MRKRIRLRAHSKFELRHYQTGGRIAGVTRIPYSVRGAFCIPPMDAFDIVIIADMACHGDLGIRIAREIQVNSADGYKVGVVHAGGRGPHVLIHPAIHSEKRLGNAKVLNPSIDARVTLLIAYPPFIRFPSFLNALSVERALVVFESSSECDLNEFHRELNELFGKLSWVATNPWLQEYLLAHHPDFPVEDFLWYSPLPAQKARKIARRKKTVGVLSNASGPAAFERLLRPDCRIHDGTEVIQIKCDRENGQPENNSPSNVYDLYQIAIDRLMGAIDLLTYHPRQLQLSHPDATIATAFFDGKPVVLAPHLRPHYGDRATYCEIGELCEVVGELVDGQQGPGAGENRRSAERAQDPYRERIATLLKPLRVPRICPSSDNAQSPPRVLFIAEESCDVRAMLAIARRAESRCRPVFTTTKSCVHFIEAFGYEAEHISPGSQTSSTVEIWRDWFQVELAHLIDTYGPRVVVVNDKPSPEAMVTVRERPNCKFALLSNGPLKEEDGICERRWFDLAVEFGDLTSGAVLPDPDGPAPLQVARVAPVTLLDDSEMLPRAAAIESLAFDSAKPAMLIRLRDEPQDASLVAQVIAYMSQIESLQIAVEWDRDDFLSTLWPNTSIIVRPTAARYLKAFDLAVATPDYSTFHESISHLLPTIFVTDTNEPDHSGNARVQRAEAAGAALGIPASNLTRLLPMARILLKGRANEYVRSSCRKLRIGNGAGEAAEALIALLS